MSEKIVSVENISEDVQMFTGVEPLEPGETRTVSEIPLEKKKTVTPEQAEELSRSPFIKTVRKSGENESVKGTEAKKEHFKGVESK